MAKNGSYKNTTCGYCGENTGPNGEGEHVLPKSMYPKTTDPRVRRLKIPSCPDCNDATQNDEGHFRTIMSLCGPDPTPERDETYAAARRNFRRPDGGHKDVAAVRSMLVPQKLLDLNGQPYYKVYPLQDERVVRVVCKIIRGLVYHRTREVIADENRVTVVNSEEPVGTADGTIEEVYKVPRVFTAWAFFGDQFDPPIEEHSIWAMKFYDSAVFAAIVRR